MSATRTFIFWTAPNAWWSRIIVRITRLRPDGSDRWSHMGLGFVLDSPVLPVSPSPRLQVAKSPSPPVPKSPSLQVAKSPRPQVSPSPRPPVPKSPCLIVYYEALLHYGFTGPHNADKLLAFQEAGRGKLAVEFTAIDAPNSEQIRRRCETWTYLKSYSAWQLLLMWAYERFGRFLGWRIPRTPGKVVCSEAVACLLWPHLDLRDPDHPDFDSVNPNSAWRVWQKKKVPFMSS